MFSDKLFNHKYDIDQLILAFCGLQDCTVFYLNSLTGDVYSQTSAPHDLKLAAEQGDKHQLMIESLPDSFITELTQCADFKRLDDDKQQIIHTLLQPVQHMHQLPTTFEDINVGGWLRHQVKQACLEWLDGHDMIPPSMRHTSDSSMFDFSGTKITVNIQ